MRALHSFRQRLVTLHVRTTDGRRVTLTLAREVKLEEATAKAHAAILAIEIQRGGAAVEDRYAAAVELRLRQFSEGSGRGGATYGGQGHETLGALGLGRAGCESPKPRYKRHAPGVRQEWTCCSVLAASHRLSPAPGCRLGGGTVARGAASARTSVRGV
eukprot:SAG11_NODE_283_length_11241_cov_8.234428_4_plen_159_part_00